jgi:xeroderma pigmentosum group C-complementing protein
MKGRSKLYGPNDIFGEPSLTASQFKLSPDADTLNEKVEFLTAAKTLRGSRDVGAQLFCALLRGAGLDVRLVCSLQPLPFLATAKASTSNGFRDSPQLSDVRTPEPSDDEEPVDVHSPESPFKAGGPNAAGMPFSARRRLGHPNAADYIMPQIYHPPRQSPKPRAKRIRESPYPVFWVEVLEEAHQKWMPVNPMDPTSVGKPQKFEPPAADPENNMSYVVAFEDDGGARDVTRRYTKAYNSKTRKNRVESTEGGEKWWRKALKFYSRGWETDLDHIEDTELASIEAREPMPKSVADFKDHPVYALERHLRRNEVLVNPREIGRVAAGRDPSGGKRLESVYRRTDVKAVKSADGWYRIGREVKVGEQPVKIVAARRRQDDEMEEDEENAGTALYTESQTEAYEAPPVVNGRVPKNSYGNLDIYVPSMVPAGGVHLPCKSSTSS